MTTMKPFLSYAWRAGLIVSASFLLTGCLNLKPVQDTTRYFVLSSEAPPAEADAAQSELRIGLRAVSIPPYLENRWLAVRTGDHEITYRYNTEWAETLDSGLLRVLGINLCLALGTEKVYLRDFNRGSIDFELQAFVFRFEPDSSGLVTLGVRWRVAQPGTGLILEEGTWMLEQSGPTASENPEGTVAAMSTVVGEFSRRLAEVLRQLPKPKPAS